MNELDIRNLCLVDFGYNFNKTRQTLSDVILQEGGRSYRYSDASQKNHVWARWGNKLASKPSSLQANSSQISQAYGSSKLRLVSQLGLLAYSQVWPHIASAIRKSRMYLYCGHHDKIHCTSQGMTDLWP